ncbi:MAG: phosphoglycolate phosphatase [Pseudomonadota bacterium]
MHNLSRPSAILFDLDGTLVDSAPDLTAALGDTLAPLGVTCSEADVRSWVGRGAKVMVERALASKRPDLLPASVDRTLLGFLEAYSDHNGEAARCYAGVKETLVALKASEVTLAVVTNKPIRFVPELLERLGIRGAFDVLVGGDSTSARKPDPEPLLEACATLGVNAQDCWMVGDSANDAEAAHAIDMPFIWMTYGYHGGATANELRPALTLDRFDALTTLVENC